MVVSMAGRAASRRLHSLLLCVSAVILPFELCSLLSKAQRLDPAEQRVVFLVRADRDADLIA